MTNTATKNAIITGASGGIGGAIALRLAKDRFSVVVNYAGKPALAEELVAGTFAYMGSLMSFLAKGSETDGRFALMEYHTKPGNEPPPHVHEREHELYFVLEGTMRFYCEDKTLDIGPGDVVFLPEGKAHAFNCTSDFVRTLIFVQATGKAAVALDRYFLEMGEPAKSMVLPESAVTYAVADPEHAIRVGASNGIRILSPSEAEHALPQYPGFGAPVR